MSNAPRRLRLRRSSVSAAIAALALGFALLWGASAQTDAPRKVLVIDVTGVIGLATTLHVEKGMEQARRENAAVVILRLDTPGGLVSSTREIVQAALASPVPVVGFVAPSGAHAASAGTYILAATHVAAMAPGTQIGAATPIQLGPPVGTNPLTPQKDEGDKDKQPAKETQGAADQKALNDAVAFIKSLAQMRGRNVDWYEKAVRDAATLTPEEAVRERAIEIVAADMSDLIAKLEGRTITIGGLEQKLALKDLPIEHVETGWRIDLLGAIADPNVAFILLMIGVYGIIFEFWNPGAIAPGVVGGICLLLALAALTALPLNYAGLALVLFGIALMTAEAFTPGFGVMGIGGLAAFVLGAIFLFDPEGSDVDISVAWPVIVGSALTSLALLTAVVGFALSARQRPAMAGGEELIGLEGVVVVWDGKTGTVRARGEIWAAVADRAFNPGDRVRVTARQGLILTVTAA